MKRSVMRFALMAAGLSLAGCVDDYGGGGYGGLYSAGSYPYGDYYDGYYGGYGGGYGRGYGYYRDRAYRPAPRYNGQRPHADRGNWNGRGRDWSRDGIIGRDRDGGHNPGTPRTGGGMRGDGGFRGDGVRGFGGRGGMGGGHRR